MRRFALPLVLSLITAPALAQEGAAPAQPFALSVDLHGGFFGLVNVNRRYTDALPAFGATVAFEADVHRYFALGVEYGLSWVSSVQASTYHLTMGPQLRARFNVDLEAGFSFFVIASTGLAIWPEDPAETVLDPRLRFTRVGWSLRIAGGVEHALEGTPVRLFVAIGYAATSTYNDALPTTIDNLLVVLGSRVRFG